MNKYKVDCMVGEGSFGRVYKAKTKSNNTTVALKLITKYGRSPKELMSLRQECEIQRQLKKHPNIIRMLDSFETENEIVVVTEFAGQDLYSTLAKKGYLKEERAGQIICDLISALYYLHSNRVLHRDLKPQNVLLGENGVAKLCDFGFARNMSVGTHVLTSIKGTPLYMAPELMEESPYDHNADLWSLGCIAYEMVVGSPPFTTTSILHLVRMIRHDPIKWPEYISLDCQNLLRGLLNKNPSQRLTWPHLLMHPFVKGKILILGEEVGVTPLTAELTMSQAKAKEIQKQHLVHRATVNAAATFNIPGPFSDFVKFNTKQRKFSNELRNADLAFKKMSISETSDAFYDDPSIEDDLKEALNCSKNENASPFEADEWRAFLQRSMEELIAGDIESVKDPAFLNMVCRALSLKYACVLEYTTNFLMIPFTIDSFEENDRVKIRQVYCDVKIIPKLVYASKLILSRTDADNNLSTDQLQALEKILLLITFLVLTNDSLLKQFCALSNALNLAPHLNFILRLRRRKIRLAINLMGTLCHVLRKLPEYSPVVKDTIRGFSHPDLEIKDMLSLNSEMLCIRTLTLINLMSEVCPNFSKVLLTEHVLKEMEQLTRCSHESIQAMAKKTLEEALNLFDSNSG